MKTVLLCLVFVAACGKKNDVSTLQHEATHVAAFYAPKIEALDKRVQNIFRRGTTIPANLPGIEEVGKRLGEARDLILQSRSLVTPGTDGKSAVEKQAEDIVDPAKRAPPGTKVEHKPAAQKAADLKKLIHDTETLLVTNTTLIADNLNAVESWIGLYDQYRAKGIQAPRQDLAAPAVDPTQPTAPSPNQPAPPTGTPAPAPPAAPAQPNP